MLATTRSSCARYRKRQTLRGSRLCRRRIFLEKLESRYMLSALGVIDPAGNNINGSTFGSGSFAITNTSQIGQQIDRIHLDLRSAIFPDMVYDPFGAAGDPVGKPLIIDNEGGTGFSSFNYLLPHDGGFDALEMFFTDFEPGETVTFSIDNDPTSIRGLPAPGPNESGSISGIELVGATLTVDFNDSTSLTGEYYRIPSTVDGSRAFVDYATSGGFVDAYVPALEDIKQDIIDGLILVPTVP